MDEMRKILAMSLPPEDRERVYEYFRRWRNLVSALEQREISDIGWGHSCPELVFVLNRRLEHGERQMLYRISESLRIPVYFTYDKPELAAEIAYLPSTVRVVKVGQDIPDVKDLLGDNPEITEKKKQVWLYLKDKAKPVEVF